MFEVPEAKRVRREDLGDSDVDADCVIENDVAMHARVNAQIAAALGLDDDDEPPASAEPLRHNTDTPAQRTSTAQVDGDEEAGEEQGYEFNLFSTAGPGGSTGPAKVILENDDEDLGDGAFVRPRPLSCYRSKAPSAKKKEEYNYAAVTADTIAQWSTQPPWGMAMPWKVISISAMRRTKPGGTPVQILADNTEEAVKRKRPGKKRRIMLRERQKTKAQAAEVAAKKQVEKEEHLKDKKRRLNKIKKLRKRAKEKEKKLAAGGEGDAVDTTSDSDDE